VAALRATYRLQLGPGLGFAQARELVPYLRDLGISHVYLSPVLQARPGSTHGYDVVDPTRVSEDLGGEEELRALCTAELGVLLDVVPNHMAADEANRYWADETLRERFFDVDPGTGRWRRFFDISELAGLRVEDPEVFEETHRKILQLVREGLVDGLRVDHPDGLADPAGYLRRLRAAGVEHVWVEKVLHPDEHLRDWPVEGTTGYEFLNDVCALFVDPAGEEPLTRLFAEVAGESRPFEKVAFEAKVEQAAGTFQPEVMRLRRLWNDAPELERALASLPVYRTYVEPWSGRVEEVDREVLREAGIEERLARVLALEERSPVLDEFVTRFQQTTPPVMAKGVEDTAFYRYSRLLALNDVGGDPSRFGIPLARFHEGNLERAQRFPRTLLSTQTHDTKRSGDVRARISALAGMADEWCHAVRRWLAIAEPLRRDGAPDGNELLLIFQTLVGAWPIEEERLTAYLEKALREAKRNTSWVEQDAAYEQRVKRFAAELLRHRPFLDDFEPVAARVAEAGERAALGQLLLKLTVPGIPDTYQGDELQDLSLVDPDNRRPVDWDARRRLLAELRAGAEPDRETMKLFVTWKALDLRARRPDAFAGAYRPRDAGDRALAFTRGDDEILVAVPVRETGWEDARIAAPGRWRDVLGDREIDIGPGGIPLAELLRSLPVSLLERI
jgi:(1->4)-alpha-D-glucan 1-alpha-D-glucosylmutase